MIVAHCPGHGIMKGTVLDKGCEHNGIVEADIVMSIAREMTRQIHVPYGHHILLRDGGCSGTYAQRALTAQNHGADIVICHHINAAASKTAHGLLVFYQHDNVVGKQVAEMIERAAPFELIRPGNDDDIATYRGDWTKNANWVMGHYRKYDIPTVLVEWGFSTNVTDAEYLLSERSRAAMAACLFAGIARAWELRQ